MDNADERLKPISTPDLERRTKAKNRFFVMFRRETLREYSTLYGLAAALVCAAVVGGVSHWSLIWMMSTTVFGLIVFSRCFYGFKAAKALHDADFELGSGKSVSWYVEPPSNQLTAKFDSEMREAEAGDEPESS